MTLYCVYVGGGSEHAGAEAAAFDSMLGEPMDGFLGYTEGWEPGNFERLRPARQTWPGNLGDHGRPIVWSVMLMFDDEGVEGYRKVARGEYFTQHKMFGQDLINYHNSIGDTTGPIYIRSTWEVPGEWFGWNVAAVQDPNAFKGAWQQFANALHSISPRIKTVWDFNSDRGEIEYLYPGDDYIDVISQDIYWIWDLQGTDATAAFHFTRYGTPNPLGAGDYAWPLQRHFEWCRGKNKPMAISEFGVKLNGVDIASLDCTKWFQDFFAFVDEVNADPRVGMAYVTWWNSDDANTGKFTARVGEPHQSNVRNMFRARVPGSALGVTTPPPPLGDRNLYVASATFNGAAVPGAALNLLSGGPQSFTFSKP